MIPISRLTLYALADGASYSSQRLAASTFFWPAGLGEPLDSRKYIDLLYEPDELLSLVVLDGGKSFGRTAVGFYHDWDRFCADATATSGRGNVYINLNRLHPDIYGRAADRLRPYAQQRFSSDEVIWRPRLCVDLDPVRFPGINSTDDELQCAVEVGNAISEYICSEWGEDVMKVNSGNGVQLVVKIDEEVSSPLVAKFLHHLDAKFSTERVKIDKSLSDAPRIVRLPGTLNCKGDNIEKRPRRMAHIMEIQYAAR